MLVVAKTDFAFDLFLFSFALGSSSAIIFDHSALVAAFKSAGIESKSGACFFIAFKSAFPNKDNSSSKSITKVGLI